MSQTVYVTESRPLDHVYDPVYANPFQDNGHGIPARALTSPHETNLVTGHERYKYFKRPIVPVLDSLPPEVILAPTAETDPLLPPPIVPEAPTKECAIQTDYRESDTQTDPYTPAYYLHPRHPDPELLLLEKLTYDKGLKPVTLLEAQLIEFQKRKHAMESCLPPATDEVSLKLRRKIMENLELQQFKIREKEIDRNREAKLQVLERLLQERNEAEEYADEQRVEVTRQEKLAKRDKIIENIQTKRLQILRKLTKERSNYHLPGACRTRDIIEEYANPASKVYAPITRDGHHSSGKVDTTVTYNAGAPSDKLSNLRALEASLPPSALSTKPTAPIAAKARHGGPSLATRNKRNSLKSDLALLDSTIRAQKTDVKPSSAGSGAPPSPEASPTTPQKVIPEAITTTSPPSPMWKAKKPVERPPTPIAAELTQDEEMEPYVLLLQRLLRGRAVQNIMYEGRHRRKDLIDELKLQDQPGSASEEDRDRRRKEKLRESTLDTMAGDLVSSLLESRLDRGVGRAEVDMKRTDEAGGEGETEESQPVTEEGEPSS